MLPKQQTGPHNLGAGGHYACTGLGLCNAQPCPIMHHSARLCTIMHDAFRRRHKGMANKRDPGTANLLSFGSRRDTTFFLSFRRCKNFILSQSIFSSGNMCRCILMDKIAHDKHNNELHGTRVKQNIMHIYANDPTLNYARLCTIMHVHNPPLHIRFLQHKLREDAVSSKTLLICGTQ